MVLTLVTVGGRGGDKKIREGVNNKRTSNKKEGGGGGDGDNHINGRTKG